MGSATIADTVLDPLAAGSVTTENDDDSENVVASEYSAESVMLLFAWSLLCDMVRGNRLRASTAGSLYG